MQSIIDKLAQAGISSPRLEARMILEYTQDQKEIDNIVEKRVSGWPLDKILGIKGFYKHNFIVNEDVLSPRPDTEILVEEAIKLIKDNNITNVLDLGTGSGCILLSILAEFPNLKGVGVDISPKALDIAKKNAAKICPIQASFLQKNWFADSILGGFDLIVSNPPYIPSNDIKTLDVEVKEHDPMLALDGGDDGLNSYKKIAELSQELLNQGGYILLEVGINQAQDVAQIFQNQGFKLINIVNDLANIERVVILTK